MSIITPVRIESARDVYLTEIGERTTVRRIEFESGIVDTSLRRLWLPPWAVEELGLTDVPVVGLSEDKYVTCEIGTIVNVYIAGQRCSFSAYQSTDAWTVVIGSIPLLALGLEADEATGQLTEVPHEMFLKHIS